MGVISEPLHQINLMLRAAERLPKRLIREKTEPAIVNAHSVFIDLRFKNIRVSIETFL